ncbi:hypothetical protein [Solilutibacter tolerans]|uniref:Uncharacterized protein n=1 Tax=Solilutibacter tolerans TaxID=1604334 RepID=A0A1N6PJ24_9GAMM|nr:hypothetical protein [Lysobacter tolerans]SIQ04296.1 hypothetical protein SAMN05421546_0635 [Lysobacter tolerans]
MMGLASLLLALAGLPAIAIAAWLAKDSRPASPGLAIRMALVGITILLGALGLYWAGEDGSRAMKVALAMALVVNALALSMWWHVRKFNPRKGV